VIVVNGGKFGERGRRSAELRRRRRELKSSGAKVSRSTWVRAALDKLPDAKAVARAASETSTTAVHPVAEIAALTRTADTLLISTGSPRRCLRFPMDQWGIDVLVTGSEKH